MEGQVIAQAIQAILASLSTDWEIVYRGIAGHLVGNVVVLHPAETTSYSRELGGFLYQDINLPKLE